MQRGRDRTISQVRPVIACIACMRPHTHPPTPTHTANNRNDRSAPHAARMQHPHRPNHREALRRSSWAARKDSCTACERTAFTPCRRTHSAVDTHQWREEPTSTWPNRRQPVARAPLQSPRHPQAAHARTASTMVEAPHHAARGLSRLRITLLMWTCGHSSGGVRPPGTAQPRAQEDSHGKCRLGFCPG